MAVRSEELASAASRPKRTKRSRGWGSAQSPRASRSELRNFNLSRRVTPARQVNAGVQSASGINSDNRSVVPIPREVWPLLLTSSASRIVPWAQDALLAVARDDLDLAAQVDDELPPRRRMPIDEVVLRQ